MYYIIIYHKFKWWMEVIDGGYGGNSVWTVANAEVMALLERFYDPSSGVVQAVLAVGPGCF